MTYRLSDVPGFRAAVDKLNRKRKRRRRKKKNTNGGTEK